MPSNIRKWLQRLLLALALVSAFMLVRQYRDNKASAAARDAALQMALAAAEPETAPKETEPESAEEVTLPAEPEPVFQWVTAPDEGEDPHITDLAQMDLNALRAVNPDVIGWIRIPGTRVDYPILQGQDNDYYLNHTWQGKSSSAGSIFMEYLCIPDFSEFHTIVYGHNMNDGSMFAEIRKYGEQKFWKKNPYVYVVTDDGVFRYDVFSCYKADVDSDAYSLWLEEAESRQAFLDYTQAQSNYDTGIRPEVTDRVLTLSTCSGSSSTRWVVHARLKMVRVQVN